MKEAAYIGDIHGELGQLDRLVQVTLPRASSITFLGDYVNRGPASRDVIEFLVLLSATSEIPCTFIAGNHDLALLKAIETEDLGPFLKMGGASTVRSYVPNPRPDIGMQFARALPPSHVEFLERLRPEDFRDGVHASHYPPRQLPSSCYGNAVAYGVYGHVPQVGGVPNIGSKSALIDTGCGTLANGRLTCLFWPSLTWIQSKR